MFVWKLAFMVLKHVVALRTLVRLAEPRRRQTSLDEATRERVEFLATRLSRTDDCLERSLVAYRFLSRAGGEPTLFIGFERDAPREGHAWVEVDSRPVAEPAEALERFVSVATFGGRE